MATFSCPDCGATFPLKPEYSGRAVRCKCGRSFTAPYVAGAAVPSEPADDDRTLASRYGVVRKRRGEDEEPEEDDGGVVRKFILPLILLAAGGAITLSQITWVPPEIPRRIMFTPGLMATIVVLAVCVAIGAVLLGARWLEYGIGNIPIAFLKIASVAVLATSLALFMVQFDKKTLDTTGFTLGWSFMVVAYWIFLPILFKLEAQETLLTVGIIALVNAIAMGAVLAR